MIFGHGDGSSESRCTGESRKSGTDLAWYPLLCYLLMRFDCLIISSDVPYMGKKLSRNVLALMEFLLIIVISVNIELIPKHFTKVFPHRKPRNNSR